MQHLDSAAGKTGHSGPLQDVTAKGQTPIAVNVLRRPFEE
jgi:hypothetical protein